MDKWFALWRAGTLKERQSLLEYVRDVRDKRWEYLVSLLFLFSRLSAAIPIG